MKIKQLIKTSLISLSALSLTGSAFFLPTVTSYADDDTAGIEEQLVSEDTVSVDEKVKENTSLTEDEKLTEETLTENSEVYEDIEKEDPKGNPTGEDITEEADTEDDIPSGGVSATEVTEAAPKTKNGFYKEGDSWVWYKDNKAVTTGTDIVLGTIDGVTGWYYIKDGKADLTKTGVEHNNNGWWFVRKGKVDFNYNGFASNKNGWWYIENGKVTFKRNDVIEGTVKGAKAWWNVKGSQVIFNETIEQNTNGWWYIKDGKVDFSYTGVKNNKNGWWYVKNGKVDFGYTGLAQNENGWWYCKNGKVTFDYTGTAENGNGIWRVEKSKVNFNYNIAKKENGVLVGFVNGKKDPKAAVVAHASGDENKKFMFGKAGDQTGEEVYYRTWNDHPWPYVIRAKSSAMAEKIAYAMERAADNDKIGYDMSQRNTLYNYASKVGWDPGKVTTPCETDCSALVTVALIYAGVNRTTVYQNNNCSVTANLRKRLISTGQFEVFSSADYTKSPDKLKRGDILLEEGEHTAVIVKPVTK